jgi:signal transduction histidine kinase
MASATLDLDRLIAGMSSLLQSAIGATNRIKVVRSDRLSIALADPSQIELVILNLAINARDAMPSGGTITIGTAEVTAGAPEHPEEPLLSSAAQGPLRIMSASSIERAIGTLRR